MLLVTSLNMIVEYEHTYHEITFPFLISSKWWLILMSFFRASLLQCWQLLWQRWRQALTQNVALYVSHLSFCPIEYWWNLFTANVYEWVYCTQFRKPDKVLTEEDIPYGYGFFHLVFAMGAMYFAMLFVGWNLHQTMHKYVAANCSFHQWVLQREF